MTESEARTSLVSNAAVRAPDSPLSEPAPLHSSNNPIFADAGGCPLLREGLVQGLKHISVHVPEGTGSICVELKKRLTLTFRMK